MTEPTDDPATASVYRPLPEGPSLRWREAAGGLRLVRYAMWASLLTHGAFSVARVLMYQGPRLDQRFVMAMSAAGVLSLVVQVVLGYGLWRYGRLPRSVGATAPARQALTFLGATIVLGTLHPYVMGLLVARLGVSVAVFASGASSLAGLVGFALHVAYLVALLRSLAAPRRALGGAWPARTSWIVPAYVGWRGLAFLLQSGLMLLMYRGGYTSFGLAWAVVSLAVDAAFAWVLTGLVRGTEEVVARQEAPESSLGG